MEWVGGSFTDKFIAVGSGQQYAYGAMEVGATASVAVEAATRRDLASAPPVVSVALKMEPGMAKNNKPRKGKSTS